MIKEKDIFSNTITYINIMQSHHETIKNKCLTEIILKKYSISFNGTWHIFIL